MDGAQISIHAGGISAAARAGNQPSGDSSRLPGHGLCGGVPAEPEPPRFRRFRRVPEAGAEQTAQPVRRGGAGRRGAFQRRVPFACFRGGPSSSPCSVLTAVSFPSPFRVSGKDFAGECSAPVWSAGIPQSMPRLFPPPFPPFPFRTFGSGHGLRFPPFRRGVSHAGREGRLDGHRAKTGSLNRRICVDRQIESLSAKAPSVTAPPSGTVQGRGGNGCFTAWSGFCFSSLAPDLKFLSLL